MAVMVTITGQADHRREAEVVDLPAEGLLVERNGRPRVSGVEITEIPCTRLVDHLHPPASPGLPDAELDALRIGQHRAPAALYRKLRSVA
jgi:hypothetical protein